MFNSVLVNNNKYEANHLLKMFPDTRKSFSRLNTLTGKMTVLASLTHPGCDRPYAAHPLQLQRSVKLKILHCFLHRC